MDVGVKEIRQWHTDPPPRGNGWLDVGYHYIIRRDGTLEHGRAETAIGSHVAGHNSHSIGVCLVGGIDAKRKPESNFTAAQWAMLEKILVRLTAKYPDVTRICGHTDLDRGKACPSFNVTKWLAKVESLRRFA